jgi:PQQ-like domain
VRSHQIVHRFDIVAGRDNLGGAWGWGGVSVDPTNGTLYTATGNSAISLNGDLVEDQQYAERVVHLSPTLRVLGSSLPPPKSPANLGDEDFGSTPLLFQPKGCPPLLAANSKNGRVLVYRRDHLGVPVWSAAIGSTNPGDPFLGQPSWDAARQQIVIAPAEFGPGTDPSKGVVAYRPASGCTRFTPVWHDNIGGGPIPAPLIAGGIVFALAQADGTVYGIDAAKGTNVWSAKIGSAFAPPATDGRTVYIAAVDGTVRAFG